jgi:hypothetical protein
MNVAKFIILYLAISLLKYLYLPIPLPFIYFLVTFKYFVVLVI